MRLWIASLAILLVSGFPERREWDAALDHVYGLIDVGVTDGPDYEDGLEELRRLVSRMGAPAPPRWSDPSNWPDGLPDRYTDVVVDWDLVIDEAEVRTLTITNGAVVTLAGDLHAHGSVVVEDTATLIGTDGTIYFHVPNDREGLGAHGHTPDPHTSGVGLWTMPGGTTNLRGRYKTPWLSVAALGGGSPREEDTPGPPVLTASDAMSGGMAEMETAPVGWTPGDRLVLTNERGRSALAVLTSVVGNVVSYDAGAFEGAALYYEDEVVGTSKVANLSRSVRIVSALVQPGDTNHRAHTIALRGADLTFQNVELVNLGPRAKLGLYPVHVHHGMDMTPAVIEGCAIYQDCGEPGNRWVVMHDTDSVICRNNVGYLSRGHGYMMEDGTERNCLVEGNLGIQAAGAEEIPVHGHNRSRLTFPHTFWLWGGNTIRNNVSVSSNAATVGIGVLRKATRLTGWFEAPGYVVEGHEHYGGFVGVWGDGDAVFEDVQVAYATFGVFPSAPGGVQLISHSSFVAVVGGVSGYAYPGHRVQDSLIVADTVVSTQGTTTVLLEDSTCYGHNLFSVENWRVGIGFDRCVVEAEDTTKSGGGNIRLQTWPLIRLRDCDAQLAGLTVVNAELVSRTEDVYEYGFEGSPLGTNGWVLDNPAPQAGWIQLGGPHSWNVVPEGMDPRAWNTRVSVDSQGQDEEFVEFFRGYPGFAPGWYDVRGYTSGGTLVGHETVEVVSGRSRWVDMR